MTKAKIIVHIGHHALYKVEDVSMIYIPACGVPSHPEEQKYAKLFQVFVIFLTIPYYAFTAAIIKEY